MYTFNGIYRINNDIPTYYEEEVGNLQIVYGHLSFSDVTMYLLGPICVGDGPHLKLNYEIVRTKKYVG